MKQTRPSPSLRLPSVRLTLVHHGRDHPVGCADVVGFFTLWRTLREDLGGAGIEDIENERLKDVTKRPQLTDESNPYDAAVQYVLDAREVVPRAVVGPSWEEEAVRGGWVSKACLLRTACIILYIL